MNTSPAPVPVFDLRRQTEALRPELLEALAGVLDSCAFSSGRAVEAFERAFAEYLGVAEVVGVNSGTSALHLALLAAGVGPGDEVITTSLTFIATAWAISYAGATPVFADIDPEDFCLDPAAARAAITPRTRAILPVHLYGQAADMSVLQELCSAKGLALVEDAAQAQGATYQGRAVGGFGLAGCFSFYPSKNLGAPGDAGAVSTNDPQAAALIRRLRDHAQREKYLHDRVGFNYRMGGFLAAALSVKLPRLDDWNERREAIARAYREGLAGLDELVLPTPRPGRGHVWHQFVVRHPRRDWLVERLAERGIGTGIHYPRPVHLQPAYAHLGLREGSLPEAERAAREVLSLPMFPELTDAEVERVVRAVRELLA
ncbi:MAG: DegT/DnrJ/EryC1/StrS family aminotransferase [Planctomycetota bacterium]|nr:MAG: DegT/DnrJ/EryC1/StrS family aminotransferase [Planctomycetota bacterium]